MSDTGHDLPDKTPDSAIRHVKRLWIYMSPTNPVGAREWIDNLYFGIEGHEPADEGAGFPVADVAGAEQAIADFLSASPPSRLVARRTPLDFAIETKCFVVLRLYGNYWEFGGSKGPIQTKNNLGGRYYHLRTRSVGGLRGAVSFCAEEPFPKTKGVKHPINLFVDFLRDRDGATVRMPVLIDPDVENRGSGGGGGIDDLEA